MIRLHRVLSIRGSPLDIVDPSITYTITAGQSREYCPCVVLLIRSSDERKPTTQALALPYFLQILVLLLADMGSIIFSKNRDFILQFGFDVAFVFKKKKNIIAEFC
jgi:hypothetical protein